MLRASDGGAMGHRYVATACCSLRCQIMEPDLLLVLGQRPCRCHCLIGRQPSLMILWLDQMYESRALGRSLRLLSLLLHALSYLLRLVRTQSCSWSRQS